VSLLAEEWHDTIATEALLSVFVVRNFNKGARWMP
jgi:hypothetical protein